MLSTPPPPHLEIFFRQQVTWTTLLGGGNNLDHVYLNGDMGIEVKNNQPFYSDHCGNLVNLLPDEKKEQSSFVVVLFVILKFKLIVLFNESILQNFNFSQFQFCKKEFRTSVLIRIFFQPKCKKYSAYPEKPILLKPFSVLSPLSEYRF